MAGLVSCEVYDRTHHLFCFLSKGSSFITDGKRQSLGSEIGSDQKETKLTEAQKERGRGRERERETER